ncbi:hypothetical protein A9Q84_14370 [Halobacteriovorax marinus]|uniref:Uncharacterized protein n=1 Tax=Halobacteriovorax marinus TaxID=97084 RepID=A0A1Y5FB72_9BACT|nr:hypothetical protein A9Q84_14370 [Halobacteriovorax marinus]
MTIVRDQGKLTLINPVRMNEEGLLALEELGEIAHVLRLGSMHGMDDQFYVDRYKTSFWSFEGGVTYTTPSITHVLTEGGELPFSGGKLIAFDHLNEPEGAILLERSKGILLTCDAIQSYSTFPHQPQTNWLAKRMLPLIGFPCETVISKMWLKLAVNDKSGIKGEFERLLKLDFDQLISAHGTFVPKNAHAEVEQAFKNKFA